MARNASNLWTTAFLVVTFCVIIGVVLLSSQRYADAFAVCMRNGNGAEFCDMFAKSYTRIIWK